MKLPRCLFSVLVLLAYSLPACPVHAGEKMQELVMVASYGMSPKAEDDPILALLKEKGITGIPWYGAGQFLLSVAAENREKALQVLGEAKEKEGLKLTLLMDATKLAIWPEGPGLKPELKLTAKLDDAGVPVVSGEIKITNLREENLTLQATSNRTALAFLVFDSLENPVAPVMRGKADPAFDTVNLAPGAVHAVPLENLDFITGSAWTGYDLKRGGSYRVIAVYRPAGKDGPGFCSDEVRLKIPD